MRDYGKVHTSFWTSVTTRGMSEDARNLAMYLLTSPHGNIAGAFRLPDGYVCDDIQWGIERVKKGFQELEKGFIKRCETTKWIWISNHFEWNRLENPNQQKSAQKIALSIPDQCSWKQEYMRVSAETLGIEVEQIKNLPETLSEPLSNPLETLPESVTVAVTEAVTVTVTEAVAVVTPESDDSSVPFVPQAVASDKPAPKKEEPPTRKTWIAYSQAYESRYGVTPVRNKTIAGQLANFVKRIGREESPHVAAFFVYHNNQFYVKKMHTVGLLLADAEKLRTEWATNKTVTDTQARQTDQTQARGNVFNKLIDEARANASD